MSTSATSNPGGQVTIISGYSPLSTSGALLFQTANAGSAGISGDILFKSGTSSVGNTGSILFASSAATQGQGGEINLRVGDGDSVQGGDLNIDAGVSSSVGGTGGDVTISGGA